MELDAVDRQLCELVAQDPRSSHRKLAQMVGVTDETVAVRLRSLRQRNVIATTVVVDWEAAGYKTGALVRMGLRGIDVGRLRAALDSPNIVFGALTSGAADLVLAVLGTDLASLRDELLRLDEHDVQWTNRRVDIVSDTLLFNPLRQTLPILPWTARDLPDPDVGLDELDVKLIDELAVAGGESSREIGRRLGVSDGTVRSRLRRLEGEGLLRLITARDPVAYGDLTEHALAFVSTDASLDLADLMKQEAVHQTFLTVGSSDVVLSLSTPNSADLAAFLLRGLRRRSGVDGVELVQVIHVLLHRTHLVRLVD